MEKYVQICERINCVTQIPLSLVDAEGRMLHSWPTVPADFMDALGAQLLLTDFLLQKRDTLHPLITFMEPGFFVGVAELQPELYAIVGLACPFPPARQEVLALCADVIAPGYLQQFCDMLLHLPVVTLYQFKDTICVLVELALETSIPAENILVVDITQKHLSSAEQLKEELFTHREEADYHIPTDFENALCSAIESGNRELLDRTLHAPVGGQVGRMSTSELRQQKYSFISLATLVSRAAIRGGLSTETAFNLSDIYCQRMDVLTDIPLIQQLCYTMLLDFCEKVRTVKNRPAASPVVRKCMEYISVHLHESIGLEELSAHCGLCSRSLSLRFKKELGVGIPEYIHLEKLQEALYLLSHSNYSLSEIAGYLNYPSQSYFTQIFKKYLGKTPQQYRDGTKH